jgi:transposase
MTELLDKYALAVEIADASTGRQNRRLREIVALVRDGATTLDVAESLGIARSTVYQHLSDPTGDAARRRKAKRQNHCVDCGRRTNTDGSLTPPLRCQACDLQRRRDGARWNRATVIDAIQRWAACHDGRPPTTTEWVSGAGPTYPATSAVAGLFGGLFTDALRAAGYEPRTTPEMIARCGRKLGAEGRLERLRREESGETREEIAISEGVSVSAICTSVNRARRERRERMGQQSQRRGGPIGAIEREIEKTEDTLKQLTARSVAAERELSALRRALELLSSAEGES